jgi:hypothetical protein
MTRSYYSNSISNFLQADTEQVLGSLAKSNEFSLEATQKDAWIREVRILKENLKSYNGKIFFEYSIPRMGRRIDVVLIIKNVIFVLEFKVGKKSLPQMQ